MVTLGRDTVAMVCVCVLETGGFLGDARGRDDGIDGVDGPHMTIWRLRR